MRLIFWIVSMMFTISANASLNLDSLVPLKTKTPFFKNDSVFNAQRFALVSGSSILALVGSYYYINSAWWAD